MIKREDFFTMPIPGENLTSNVRAWPWHKPPQYANFDDAFEYFLEDVLADQDRITSAVIMSRNGFSSLVLVQNLMIQAVGAGKISPDMALLLSGPVYKVLTTMLDALGEDYMSGYETAQELKEYAERWAKKEPKTKKKFKLSAEQEAEMERITEEATAEVPVGGLMGAKSDDTVQIPMDMSRGGLVQEPIEETK
jgi:hypothetical protein